MKRLSNQRERIFQTDTALRAQPNAALEGDWVNLYALLEVPDNASTRELDEAIIDRGADVVYFTFSRTGKPPHIKLLEEYLHDMRPILLDAPTRRRYDEQLRLHKDKDPGALSYDEFKRTLDLREYSGGCMNSLVFLLGAPLTFWMLEKFI